tara:strand:+ start:403 stop:1548 length:1146 start_codon:yes stop_codon:yes gene_type:complete
MKIGVFLSKRISTEGGGYTITEEIVDALISNINKNKSQSNFFFLINNDKNNLICSKLKKNKISYKKTSESKGFKIIFTFISHFFKWSNFLLNSLNILKINNIFKDEKCDKILFISSEHREKINTPYISTVWDMQHETHPEFAEVSSFGKKIYKKFVYNNFIKEAETVIVGTKVGKSQVKKYTKFNNKFLILPHPISKIFLKKKKITSDKKKYFFYPANFWQHKNHINLLLGFKEFLKKNKQFKLVLTGEKKNNYSKIVYEIDKLNISNNVHIAGHVSTNKLINLYDKCFAVIYPSFSGPENLPPLEALARKKILINSIYPGATEQLKKFPIYVNPNSPRDIAKSMEKTKNRKLDKKKIKFFLKSKSSKMYVENLLKALFKV